MTHEAITKDLKSTNNLKTQLPLLDKAFPDSTIHACIQNLLKL